MSGLTNIFRPWRMRAGLPLGLWLVWLAIAAMALSVSAEEKAPLRLLDRQPFDRVTLNESNRSEVIDALLLDLADRRNPNSFPASGSLQLRRLTEPSVLYSVPWISIARIDLYEQLLLAEAVRLANSRDLNQAYEYFDFLHQNYPDLEGLQLATEKYLRQEALAAYTRKNYEETVAILLSLYDLNPRHRGLARFVTTVTDRLIAKHLATRDFSSARSVLDMLSDGFPELQLASIESWREKFKKGAMRQLSIARRANEEGQYSKARKSLRRALTILPTITGAATLMAEIDRRSPQIVVAVDQLVSTLESPLDWTTARVAQLTQPTLLKLTGFGAEGGNYDSPWVKISSNDTGLQLDLELSDLAFRKGISAETLTLELLKLANPDQPQYQANFAGLLRHITIDQGNLVNIHWQHSHVRPEALLPLAVQDVLRSTSPTNAYQSSVDDDPRLVTYRLPSSEDKNNGPQVIVERLYDNEEATFADLLSGEVDVVARVSPWQVEQWQQTEGIVVAPYRLPAIHVLLPNYKKPIMARREFRRALCYGIDRTHIVNDLLLGGKSRRGFRVLSAPLPAGITLTDPVGYAYNQSLQPRPYRPRLAAVLAAVAKNSLSKLAATEGKADEQGQETDNKEHGDPLPVEPLVLAHPPDAVATAACQSIKLQLDAIGFSVKLKALDPHIEAAADDYDLLYAKISLWEPIVDARRLLGPHGLAGHCSTSMSLALQDVDQAKNWKEARARLKEVHKIAYNDLQVIPLWQTVEFFAHRESLRGLNKTPVTLYQNVVDWRRVASPGGGL